jgi:polar amino acid transport system substrate-binding protein
MHFRILQLISLLILLLGAGVGAQAEPPSLIVGMELAYPPFEMTDTGGKPTGISVDLANALGAHLKRTVEIQNLPFDGLIPSLKTGRIHLIISSMTANAERAKAIDFSDPYLSTGLCLLVAKNSTIESIADADQKNRTIAVKQGTTGHLFSRNIKNAKIVVLDRESACVLEVVQGKADAFIYDQMSVLKHSEQNSETTRPLLTPFQTESWAIGLRKGDNALKKEVNAFIDAFRDSKGFETLGDRWLTSQKAAFLRLGIPFVF